MVLPFAAVICGATFYARGPALPQFLDRARERVSLCFLAARPPVTAPGLSVLPARIEAVYQLVHLVPGEAVELADGEY
jgi:predicted RNA polymerase sigma factor